MNLLEGITGNRVNYSANVLGGVKCDLTAEIESAIRTGMDFLDERTQHYLEVVTTDAMFLRRTQGIGIMSQEQAESLGIVGPTARASGVARDVRVDSPYAAYREFPITMVVDPAGDLLARCVVRVKELFESYRVIRAILDQLPEGELTARIPRRIKPGETISRAEAPRGELLYFIKSNGTDMPERVKVRTPTLPAMASIAASAVGHQLADIPMIISGIDPCFSCNDRMFTISETHRGDKSMSWEELRQYGIEYYK